MYVCIYIFYEEMFENQDKFYDQYFRGRGIN